LSICYGDPEKEGCVGPAPVESSDPFANVGLLDTQNLTPLNVSLRQYKVHDQAAHQVQILVVFIAQTLTASSSDNARLCRNHFRASARTLGARLNPTCLITPAPSAEPHDGMLTCQVYVQFINSQSFMEKNCYVTGIFAGGENSLETLQIVQ